MEALFSRYFWVVKAAGVLAGTYLAASAVTTQIGASFLLDPDSAREVAEKEEPVDPTVSPGFSTAVTKRASADRAKLAQQIQERNPFCPTCTAAAAEVVVPLQVASESGDVSTVPQGAVRTALPLKLMATMESSDPLYSFATILDTESSVAGLYGAGDSIRPEVKVTGVSRGLVQLRNRSAFEYLDMDGMAPPPPAKTVAPVAEEGEVPADPQNEIAGAAEAINCPSENLCIIEKKFVEEVLSNPAKLTKQARVVPSVRDGQTRGYKFYGIRRDSLPRLLGLKNGDLLMAVNGEEINSVDRAMMLYQKLRRASNLSITVERRGETITKEIQIK